MSLKRENIKDIKEQAAVDYYCLLHALVLLEYSMN
jgi:hypothetical protein